MCSPRYYFQQTGPAAADIFDGEQKIAEIRDLQFCLLRFAPTSEPVICQTYPMPLYWWQYSNHEDPDRNTGSSGRLVLILSEKERIVFRCTSSNLSESAFSEYEVTLKHSNEFQSYVCFISAKLIVPEGKEWLVTPNAAHGEVEFCNFWPNRVFTYGKNERKLFQACYAVRKNKVLKIPYHHLETSDKHNIHLEKGDKFLWALEDRNPVLEILSEKRISAGICAYMWDAHFGFRVCKRNEPVSLKGKTEFRAQFNLYSLNRSYAAEIIKNAIGPPSEELMEIPIYMDRINTFSQTILDFPDKQSDMWPWEFSTESRDMKQVYAQIDRTTGCSDTHSLIIRHTIETKSAWTATTIGPAFGEMPFPNNVRLKLTAYVKTDSLHGTADIAIRFFTPKMGNVFDLSDYALVKSEQFAAGTRDWQKFEIITEPISPVPERVHILLQLSGSGTAWFDDVLLEKI